jgi:hypothetical protein
MHVLQVVSYIAAVALGIAAYWVPKLVGPAVAALAFALLIVILGR